MPAKGPVSILWQIIFVVFVPFLDLWAFYRIKKLRKYLLYVFVPQLVIGIIVTGLILGMAFEENSLEKLENFSDFGKNDELALNILGISMGLGFIIFSIYLIATWSEKWNKQFSNSWILINSDKVLIFFLKYGNLRNVDFKFKLSIIP